MNQHVKFGRIKRLIFSIGRRRNPPRFGEWKMQFSQEEKSVGYVHGIDRQVDKPSDFWRQVAGAGKDGVNGYFGE